MTMKSEYLTCYDYGTGDAWAYLVADSATQIRERVPQHRRHQKRIPRCVAPASGGQYPP